MKIVKRTVVEITDKDLKTQGFKPGQHVLLSAGRLGTIAELIIYRGRVIKNKGGDVFRNSKGARS